MKRAILACAFLVLLVPASLRAQNYSIDWYTIGGGGGSSGGGNYSLSGTIGQPATSSMSGGNYSLTGGFWSLISTVATPGAPTLSISLYGNSAVLSWPATSATFRLENKPSLAVPAGWSNVAGTPTEVGGIYYVTNPITAGTSFYRLVYP